jgi:two-component system, NarL family, response regulator DesR
MSADTATSNDPVREPSVGVVGSGPFARRLIAVLKRDGLDAGPATSSRRSRTPDVLVLAVDSLSAAKSEITGTHDESPGTELVVVVGEATPAEARQLLVDSVRGLVLEEHVEATLALTARAAVAGQICYPAELMPTHLKAALSTREKQILGMLVLGFRNAEIAAKLHVSESTVKSHLYSAFATLGVRTRKEAVALILDPEAGFGTGILAITDSGSR